MLLPSGERSGNVAERFLRLHWRAMVSTSLLRLTQAGTAPAQIARFYHARLQRRSSCPCPSNMHHHHHQSCRHQSYTSYSSSSSAQTLRFGALATP